MTKICRQFKLWITLVFWKHHSTQHFTVKLCTYFTNTHFFVCNAFTDRGMSSYQWWEWPRMEMVSLNNWSWNCINYIVFVVETRPVTSAQWTFIGEDLEEVLYITIWNMFILQYQKCSLWTHMVLILNNWNASYDYLWVIAVINLILSPWTWVMTTSTEIN